MSEFQQNVMGVVHYYPGIYLRQLARELKAHISLVAYHLTRLERLGSVISMRDRGLIRFFPSGPRYGRESIRSLVCSLRNKPLGRILLYLHEHGPRTMKEIIDELHVKKSTVHSHLQLLENRKQIQREGPGRPTVFALAQRELLDTVLEDYHPAKDEEALFADLWLDAMDDVNGK